MRAKLFLAFFAVILIALLSSVIFRSLMVSDFVRFVEGGRADQLYWVMAATEGSYQGDGWDRQTLANSLHWAMMLGFDAEVVDSEGRTVTTSHESMEQLNPSMQKRMNSIVHPHSPIGEFEAYPLFVGGREIGELRIRPLSRAGLETDRPGAFAKRRQTFFLLSFIVAGGAALVLSVALSYYLSSPIRRLKAASDEVAKGNLSVSVKVESSDETGELASSFNYMVETLRREESLRKRLMSNIAHELRTPLTIIKANIEAASDGVTGGKEALEHIGSETARLIELVSGIEDVTKAEAGFFKKTEFEDIELRAFLDGIVQGLSPLFRQKGILLSLSEGSALRASTDPAKLESILRNILSNALRHTEKGGVAVSYGTGPQGVFFIEVSDTGPGVPEAERGKIFDRFYRGEGSRGIGLGLSIAKELAEVMGGAIMVSESATGGASFRVVLPASSS